MLLQFQSISFGRQAGKHIDCAHLDIMIWRFVEKLHLNYHVCKLFTPSFSEHHLPQCSGTSIPGLYRHHSRCVSQMGVLVHGMSAAIKTVSHLKLCLQCVRINNSRIQRENSGSGNLSTEVRSDNHFNFPAPMFASLAASVPQLQHLSLEGQSRATSCGVMTEFGSVCPFLTHLTVEAIAIHVEALLGIELALPNLAHITFTSNGHISKKQIQKYMDSTCQAMRGCDRLQILELEFGPEDRSNVLLTCTRLHAWDYLPSSLNDLRSNIVLHVEPNSLFLRNIQVLTLKELPCRNLQELLAEAPSLHTLNITGGAQTELMWSGLLSKEELSYVKTRLSSGLQLSSSEVGLTWGSSESVRDLTAWVAPLQDTRFCQIILLGALHSRNCLDHIIRAFPNLVHLALEDQAGWSDPALIDEEFLKPLVGCRFLEKLDVCVQLQYTNSGLVSLCMGLPALTLMYCLPYEGLHLLEVMTDLTALGRDITIIEMTEAGGIPP